MPRFLAEVLTWDDHTWMRACVKAAVDSGQPPLAVILEDATHTEWSVWDLKILKATYLLEQYEVEGWPIWYDESKDITFVAKKRTSKAAAALEKAQHQDQKRRTNKKTGETRPAFGERWYVLPELKKGADRPTLRKWSENRKVEDERILSDAADPDKVNEYRERRARKANRVG